MKTKEIILQRKIVIIFFSWKAILIDFIHTDSEVSRVYDEALFL